MHLIRSAADLAITDFSEKARVFPDRNDQLFWSIRESVGTGHLLEFGVWQGWSINRVAKEFPDLHFWGFDSFEGLPEPWVRTRAGDSYGQGHFAVPALPNTWKNVTLVKGFFEDSLPGWLEAHPGEIRFAHIDCDLYSASKFVLDTLNARIVPGTIIVFDELCDWEDSGVYDAWEEGEWKALLEWLEATGRRIEVLSRDTKYSAVIRVID